MDNWLMNPWLTMALSQIKTSDAPQKQQITEMRKKLEEAYTQLDEMEQTLSDLRFEKKKVFGFKLLHSPLRPPMWVFLA